MDIGQAVYEKENIDDEINDITDSSKEIHSLQVSFFRYLLHEIGLIIPCITLPKVWNLLLLRISYWVSMIIKQPLQWGLPANIAIEPTSVCNLACPECPSGNGSLLRRRGNISWSLFTKSIDELKKYLFSATLYFQGEPFLNPHIFDMIAFLKKNRIYSIISTNAQFLSPKNCEKLIESGLDRIVVSLDGLDQEAYSKYRVGGSYTKVIDGVKNLVEAKRKYNKLNPIIYLQFLVFSHNEHQVLQVKKTGEQLGVDKVTIKAPQIYDFKKNGGMIPSNPAYSRYEKDHGGQYRMKGQLKNKCWRSWQNPVITVDGDLLPCCFDKDAEHAYGNVKNVEVVKVWKDKKANQFKRSILKDRRQQEICRNCTEGLKYMHS